MTSEPVATAAAATPPAATTGPARDRRALLRLVALGGLAVGAVLALVAGSRPWWRASGSGVSVSFTGTETTGGLAQALALVVLAGALLGLVLKSRGRRVLGVLLVLTGVGVLVLGLDRPRPSSGTVRSRVLEVSLADQFALVGTAWPYVFAFAGLLVLGAAGVMAMTAPRWPSRTARFERPGAAGSSGATTAEAAADVPREDDPAALWRLLDAGVDPTAAEEEHTDDSPTSRRPVVSEPPSGVTMKPRVVSRTDEPT